MYRFLSLSIYLSIHIDIGLTSFVCAGRWYIGQAFPAPGVTVHSVGIHGGDLRTNIVAGSHNR